MAGVPHLPERAHFGKAPAEPVDQPLFIIHGVETSPGSPHQQAGAEDVLLEAEHERSAGASPANRVLVRGRTRRLSLQLQETPQGSELDLQIGMATPPSSGNPRARPAGRGILRQATIHRSLETEAEVARSPSHSADLTDFLDGRQHPRLERGALARQATMSRQSSHIPHVEEDLSIGFSTTGPNVGKGKPGSMRRQVTGLTGIHTQEETPSPEGSMSALTARSGAKRRALQWGRQVTRCALPGGDEQGGAARVLWLQDGSPRSQKQRTREEYIADVPDILEPSDSMVSISRSSKSNSRSKGSAVYNLELDDLWSLPASAFLMEAENPEPEQSATGSTEKRAHSKAKGGKLGKPPLRRQRRTPSASSLERSDDAAAKETGGMAEGLPGKSGEDSQNVPKKKQRKRSGSSGRNASARGQRKGSKPATAKRSPSRGRDTSQISEKEAKSRSASRSLSNLSDTDKTKSPSKQRTSSMELEKTPSRSSARRSLSREASGSSAGNRVNSGNLSASSRPGSAAASPGRGLRSGRMTPRRREARRKKLRRRLASASQKAPMRRDGKASFLRKAWSQARTALLGLPEPETQDDNDPKAKGLRGWNAARALCIGTGRALQDSKRIMTIVRQAADEAYHRHCLQNAIIDEIGRILRTSLANVSDDMDETIGDILMDLQQLKIMDMSEVGALVCEAILNFDDCDDESRSAEAGATEVAPASANARGEMASLSLVKRPAALQSLRDELWQHVHQMPNREEMTGMDDDEIEMQLDRIVNQVDDMRKQLAESTRLSIGRRRSSLRESHSRLSGIGVVDMPSDGRESVDSILSRLSGVSRSGAASRASSTTTEDSRPRKSPSTADKPQLTSRWRSVQQHLGRGSLTRGEEEPPHSQSLVPDAIGSVMSAETASISDLAKSTSLDHSPRVLYAEELKPLDRQALLQRLQRQDTSMQEDESEGRLGRSWGSTWSPPAKPPKLKVRGRSPGHSPSRERLRPAQVTPVSVPAPSLVEVSQRSVLYAAMTTFPHMQKANAVIRSKKSAKYSVKEVSVDGAVLPSLFLPRPLSPNSRRQGGG